MTARETFAVVPLPTSAPARFEPWDEAIRGRCFELWSTIAGRSAARTLRLLEREIGEHATLPDASTLSRWATDEYWADRAEADLTSSQGKTLRRLQVSWLAALELSQQVQLDAMSGAYDGDPSAGAIRVKAAESVQRTIGQFGFLARLPDAQDDPEHIDFSTLSTAEKEAYARQLRLERKGSDTKKR